jgi:cytochrome c oxidase subunit IV
MVETTQKEVTTLNMVLLALAVLSLVVAGWTVVSNGFRAGTDDVFLIVVCLTLALMFAVPPLLWARENGMLKNPFAEDEVPEGGADMEMAHGEEHGGSNKQNIIVWGALLALTAFEVLLAYIQVPLTIMLIVLMGASIIKAALIVAYFMHLKFERLSLIITIVPTLVVLLCLFAILFPDSFRLHDMRPVEPVHAVEHEG